MTNGQRECDAFVIVGIILVFLLPVTILVPDFSVWDVIPKVRVTRYHALAYEFTWPELNGSIMSILTFLFCLYLELRKRRLDEIAANVYIVNDNTEATLNDEPYRQTAALQVCVELLDSSAEHYENLVLLRDELRRTDKLGISHPPTIDCSSII